MTEHDQSLYNAIVEIMALADSAGVCDLTPMECAKLSVFTVNTLTDQTEAILDRHGLCLDDLGLLEEEAEKAVGRSFTVEVTIGESLWYDLSLLDRRPLRYELYEYQDDPETLEKLGPVVTTTKVYSNGSRTVITSVAGEDIYWHMYGSKDVCIAYGDIQESRQWGPISTMIAKPVSDYWYETWPCIADVLA